MFDCEFAFLRQLHYHFAYIQDADDLVDFAFIDPQLVVVVSGQLVPNFLHRGRQIQCFYLHP